MISEDELLETEEEWETEEWLEEWTEEETIESPEGTAPSLPESTASEKSCNNNHSETDCPEGSATETSASMGSESLPPEDPWETNDSATDFKEEATMGYQFSSTELADSVENVDNVYLISIRKEDGSTACYALDAITYSELADLLYDLLNTIVSIP